MNQLDLKGRVAIVTGGAQGIGYAAAERMLQSGASVVLWDIDAARLALAEDALATVAGPAVRARVRFERDERIAGIVANWPKGATAKRAAGLGLLPEANFEDIIRQYIADNALTPEALKGLNP